MRTIKNLINHERKVYISMRNRAIRYRFMSDAEREGITYGDGVTPTERHVDPVMALRADGTICFVGWAGMMAYRMCGSEIIRIDYEKYVDGDECYVINPDKYDFKKKSYE